ncbi:MAG: phosphate transporter ATP-binding protein [uncultured bacterium]|nr:MAG: phosphate transporter ATP-binding protein [uncultured bacterium]HLD46154.1 phosphate ABC transporter ATP-binding protein [bacterium]
MNVKLSTKDLHVSFSSHRVLRGVSFDIFEHEILSIIGPANSGKSTLLSTFNRMIDRYHDAKMTGTVLLDGMNVATMEDVASLRCRVGIVYATPIPLPMTIRENILFGPSLTKRLSRVEASDLVEKTLKASVLWDEVKDRLDSSALALSGGQQQRLCMARTLAVNPEVILFDEPCSGLDPISTAQVEEAMKELKKDHTLVLVTNNTKQAARVGDRTAFLLMGELVEVDQTNIIFTKPTDKRTEDYVTGKFG